MPQYERVVGLCTLQKALYCMCTPIQFAGIPFSHWNSKCEGFIIRIVLISEFQVQYLYAHSWPEIFSLIVYAFVHCWERRSGVLKYSTLSRTTDAFRPKRELEKLGILVPCLAKQSQSDIFVFTRTHQSALNFNGVSGDTWGNARFRMGDLASEISYV